MPLLLPLYVVGGGRVAYTAQAEVVAERLATKQEVLMNIHRLSGGRLVSFARLVCKII